MVIHALVSGWYAAEAGARVIWRLLAGPWGQGEWAWLEVWQ
jgi:hypothetical protein